MKKKREECLNLVIKEHFIQVWAATIVDNEVFIATAVCQTWESKRSSNKR